MRGAGLVAGGKGVRRLGGVVGLLGARLGVVTKQQLEPLGEQLGRLESDD